MEVDGLHDERPFAEEFLEGNFFVVLAIYVEANVEECKELIHALFVHELAENLLGKSLLCSIVLVEKLLDFWLLGAEFEPLLFDLGEGLEDLGDHLQEELD